MIPALIVLAALALIYFEFFVPGGIMGTLGAVLFVTALILYANDAPSMLHVFVFSAGAIIALVLAVQFALYHVRSSGSKNTVYLNSDQEGFLASNFDREVVGKEGEAVSDLGPSGHVVVEGKRYQALSRVGYLEKGTPIKVVEGEGAHLIVKPVKKEEAK